MTGPVGRILVLCLSLAAITGLVALAGADLRAESGLPLPRFASLHATKVNVRTGPGVRYPVEWVFVRRGLPVEVVAEFENWRKVRDWQGTEGWVHQSMLTGKRRVVVTGDVRTIRRKAGDGAAAVARAEPGTLGRLLECAAAWCRVEIAGFKGWIRREEVWGVGEDETFP